MTTFTPKIVEKHWRPEMELEVQELWEKERPYDFDKKSTKPKFSIDTPPPYASGRWHVGAAIHYSQIDMIARSMRMRGFATHFPFGIDRNGLPVEVETEKHHEMNMFEVGREKFLDLCRAFLDENEADILSVVKRLGVSADFENLFKTDGDLWRGITQSSFIWAWEQGLVYEDYRPNNYCPRCRTTLADAEVEYEEREGELVYLKFQVGEEELVVATTRPELLAACAAVIYNPKDERYKALKGRVAITPLGKKVPIEGHHSAKPEFGTGLVMVCSYGDKADVQVFRDLDLKPTIIIDGKGKITGEGGEFAGLSVQEARASIVEHLKAKGLVVRVERSLQRIPMCWRCGEVVEIIAMKEYYLRQREFIDQIRALEEQVKFYPGWAVRYLDNWLDSVKTDWPISRRRYYGTEIPIWYCRSCGEPVLPRPGRYYRPWKENWPFGECPHCGSSDGFLGEERVLDTWMDSSISPLVYNGYGWDEDLYATLGGPSDLRPQGKDIVRTWLYYTLLRGYQLEGKLPFEHIWISGMGLDATGRAMHRHLGNVIAPIPLLKRYGADSVRLFGAMEAHHGADFRISEGKMSGAFKFLQKLWNVTRFVSSFPLPKKNTELYPTDLWILGEANRLIEKANRGYEALDFFDPPVSARHFVWEIFAPHYLEMVKDRAYGRNVSEEERDAAHWTLHAVLMVILRLMAPIIPHITDWLWREIYGGCVHTQIFPQQDPSWQTEYADSGGEIAVFNSSVWKKKKEMGISLKEPIKWEIPKDLEPFEADLKRLHNM